MNISGTFSAFERIYFRWFSASRKMYEQFALTLMLKRGTSPISPFARMLLTLLSVYGNATMPQFGVCRWVVATNMGW